MNIQPKARSESTGHKGSKRTSPSHQIYLLSGHAKRVASALRNVFKSDTKEESSKSKEQVHSHGKYLSVDPMRTSMETVSVENSWQGLLFVFHSRGGEWSFKKHKLHANFLANSIGLIVTFFKVGVHLAPLIFFLQIFCKAVSKSWFFFCKAKKVLKS